MNNNIFVVFVTVIFINFNLYTQIEKGFYSVVISSKRL